MIALNELISNQELFKSKYKLMGKRYNKLIDSIIALSKDFSLLDKQNNTLRADCNKKCGEIAELVNQKKPTNKEIREIDCLNNTIFKNDKILRNKFQILNKKLKHLHNLPIDDNVLNIQLKTTCDENYNKDTFIKTLKTFGKATQVKQKNMLALYKNVVLKEDDMPFWCVHNKKMVGFFKENARDFYDKILDELLNHSKFLIKKSIKALKKCSSLGFVATLYDDTNISVDFSGEYLSRNYAIKYKNKKLDMTKFAENILIEIH